MRSGLLPVSPAQPAAEGGAGAWTSGSGLGSVDMGPVWAETRRTRHTPHVAVGSGPVIVLCSHVGLHRLSGNIFRRETDCFAYNPLPPSLASKYVDS